jgi:hypothetical protein
MRVAGVAEPAAALANRAAHAPLDDPAAVARLLLTLREAGAVEQVRTLVDRLPVEGLFDLFRNKLIISGGTGWAVSPTETRLDHGAGRTLTNRSAVSVPWDWASNADQRIMSAQADRADHRGDRPGSAATLMICCPPGRAHRLAALPHRPAATPGA